MVPCGRFVAAFVPEDSGTGKRNRTACQSPADVPGPAARSYFFFFDAAFFFVDFFAAFLAPFFFMAILRSPPPGSRGSGQRPPWAAESWFSRTGSGSFDPTSRRTSVSILARSNGLTK